MEGHNSFGSSSANVAGELCTEILCTYFTFQQQKAQREMFFHHCEAVDADVPLEDCINTS